MPYCSEEDLFNVAIETPFVRKFYEGDTSLKMVEPKGLFGVPDLLTIKRARKNSSKIMAVAFEMKLRNWKRALAQAFRYRAFSDLSYVMIDHHYIKPAVKQIHKFENANVGLVSIDCEGVVHTHFKPSKEVPYCDSFNEKVRGLFEDFLENASCESAVT